jgi:hypothetical protein
MGLEKIQQPVSISPTDKEGDGEASGGRRKSKGKQGLASVFCGARYRLFHNYMILILNQNSLGLRMLMAWIGRRSYVFY